MDITSFNTLATRLRPSLQQAASRWLRNAPRGCDTPDDIVQDTLLRLWVFRDRIDTYSSVDALAMAAARNVAIDALRRTGSRNAESIDESTDRMLSNDPLPDQAIDIDIAENLASQLLSQLPDRQALIVKMRHSDGLELSEIAALTGISEGNVRTLLSRGRSRLRQLYLSNDNYHE